MVGSRLGGRRFLVEFMSFHYVQTLLIINKKLFISHDFSSSTQTQFLLPHDIKSIEDVADNLFVCLLEIINNILLETETLTGDAMTNFIR